MKGWGFAGRTEPEHVKEALAIERAPKRPAVVSLSTLRVYAGLAKLGATQGWVEAGILEVARASGMIHGAWLSRILLNLQELGFLDMRRNRKQFSFRLRQQPHEDLPHSPKDRTKAHQGVSPRSRVDSRRVVSDARRTGASAATDGLAEGAEAMV
jgi:hypothetical protein